MSYDTRPDRSYQKLSATKRHRVRAIDIDNSHYLSQIFCTVYVALQYSRLNSPALLFVGREECGRARLTIGPIGRIVMLEVPVTRPPNAPVSKYFASALSTVQAKVGPEDKNQCTPRENILLKEKTRPSSQDPTRNCPYILFCGQLGIIFIPGQTAKLDPRARCESQKPRASASAVFLQSPHLRKAPGHQDNSQPPRVQARRDHLPTGVKPDLATTAIQRRTSTHLQG